MRRTPLRRPARTTAAVSALALASAGLVACSSGDSGSGDGRPKVVASTSVYGDIAEAVAGDKAEVDEVISDPTADPHSFEASPADAAKVTGADLVVYNGAGYDSFVDDALANAGDARTVVAVEQFTKATGITVEAHDHAGHDHGTEEGHGADEHAGHDHGAEESAAPSSEAADAHDHGAEGGDAHDHPEETSTDNEHVWFSLPTAKAVADAVAEQLAELDPEDAQTYRDNAKAFGEKVTPLEQKVSALGEKKHAHYVQTEPIGAHLFSEADFHDVTPDGFLTAVEEDQDPPAADFVAARDLLTKKEADFLAFNTQTSTGATTQLREAATKAGVPVVELSETLPEGKDYVTWMTDQIAEIEKAVQG